MRVDVSNELRSARLAFGHMGELTDVELLGLRVQQLERLAHERLATLNFVLENNAHLVSRLPDHAKFASLPLADRAYFQQLQGYRTESDPIRTFLDDSCVVGARHDDFLSERELIDGFNLWLGQRGGGMWGRRTVSLRFKAEASHYRNPTTGRSFTKSKQDVTGYRGIRFTDIFRESYDDAARNQLLGAARGGAT